MSIASPLRMQVEDVDPVGLQDEILALSRVEERTIAELRGFRRHWAKAASGWVGQVDWLSVPPKRLRSPSWPQGILNTEVNVYALHRCLDGRSLCDDGER